MMNAAEIFSRARSAGRTALDERSGKALLDAFGIAVPRSVVVAGAGDSHDALETLKPPYVVKVVSPDILHKSDAGGVKVDLKSADEVAQAIRAMMQQPAISGSRIDGFLVEEMASAGQEIVIGGLRDPDFGPLVMVGLGGIFVEVFADVAFRICPITRVDAEEISADPRSRRRRTIEAGQLALALEGAATHAYAVSFIVTNIPANDHPGQHAGNAETILEVEAWFRRRTDIEDRIREAKLGAALRHLPSGHHVVNTVWMWAALLAGNLSTLLQALTGIDEHGRAHAARLRHQLLCVPARLVRHGRTLTLRLPPGDHLLPVVLTRIRELDVAA